MDGADPLGINPVFVITPGEKVNFTVPTMQIVTGLDPIASSKLIDAIFFKIRLFV